jgi:hypothetical protein
MLGGVCRTGNGAAAQRQIKERAEAAEYVRLRRGRRAGASYNVDTGRYIRSQKRKHRARRFDDDGCSPTRVRALHSIGGQPAGALASLVARTHITGDFA